MVQPNALSGALEVEVNADNSIKAKLFSIEHSERTAGGTGVTRKGFHGTTTRMANPGVIIGEGGIRLGALISRLGDNSDSAVASGSWGTGGRNAGPREEYDDDASVDFALENDVVYQHIDPAIGASYPFPWHRHSRPTSKSYYDPDY